ELDLLAIARILRQRWGVLVGATFVGFLLFFTYAVTRPRTYSAEALFLPHVAERPVNNLASQLGLVEGGAQAGESPAFYASLLQTRAILTAAIDSEYAISQDGAVRQGNLAEVLTLEEAAADPDETLEWLSEALDVTTNSVGTVSFAVTTPDSILSEQIADRLLRLVGDFNLRHRQSRAGAERVFLEERLGEVETELREAEHKLQTFLQQNRQYQNSPELMFEHDRLRRVIELRQQVFTDLRRSFEQARLNEVKDVPLITIIDEPLGSAKPVPRGSILRGLMGAILFGVLATFWILLRAMGRPAPSSAGVE